MSDQDEAISVVFSWIWVSFWRFVVDVKAVAVATFATAAAAAAVNADKQGKVRHPTVSCSLHKSLLEPALTCRRCVFIHLSRSLCVKLKVASWKLVACSPGYNTRRHEHRLSALIYLPFTCGSLVATSLLARWEYYGPADANCASADWQNDRPTNQQVARRATCDQCDDQGASAGRFLSRFPSIYLHLYLFTSLAARSIRSRRIVLSANFNRASKAWSIDQSINQLSLKNFARAERVMKIRTKIDNNRLNVLMLLWWPIETSVHNSHSLKISFNPTR